MLTSGFFHFFFCVLQDLIDLVAYLTYRLYYFSKYRQFFTHKMNIGMVVATMWTFNDMNITNSINKDHRKSDHIRQTWQLLILLMANIIFVTWRSFYCSTPKLKMIKYFSFCKSPPISKSNNTSLFVWLLFSIHHSKYFPYLINNNKHM